MEIDRRHFETIDSTIAWVKRNCQTLDPCKLTLVTAEEQTDGKGRYDRPWHSPPGQNIYATFCSFIDSSQIKSICNVTQVLAISIAKTLESFGLTPELKWPNDILLSRKKVGGILASTHKANDKYCLMTSYGLNVNMPLNLLLKINQPATSLCVEAKHQFDLEQVIQDILKEYAKNMDLFFACGFTSFLACFKKYHLPFKQVRFSEGNRVWEGTIHAINPDGSLSIILSSGELKTFYSGEII